MFGWLYEHQRKQIIALKKSLVDSYETKNYWVNMFLKEHAMLGIEKERNEKLLRKLAYYRRKLKRTQAAATQPAQQAPAKPEPQGDGV